MIKNCENLQDTNQAKDNLLRKEEGLTHRRKGTTKPVSSTEPKMFKNARTRVTVKIKEYSDTLRVLENENKTK